VTHRTGRRADAELAAERTHAIRVSGTAGRAQPRNAVVRWSTVFLCVAETLADTNFITFLSCRAISV